MADFIPSSRSDQFIVNKFYVIDRSSDGNYYCICTNLKQALSIMVERRQHFKLDNHKIYTYIGVVIDSRYDLMCNICKTKYISTERTRAGKCCCCCCDHFCITRLSRVNLKRVKKFD